MSLQQLLTSFKPWTETVATVTYCGTEKVDLWRAVVRYQYSFQAMQYEGVKLFSKEQNIHSQMDARLLADKLLRQYPIGSEHSLKVHKKEAWLSKLI